MDGERRSDDDSMKSSGTGIPNKREGEVNRKDQWRDFVSAVFETEITCDSIAAVSKSIDLCRSQEYGTNGGEVLDSFLRLLDSERYSDAVDCGRYLEKLQLEKSDDEDTFLVMKTRVRLGRALLGLSRFSQAYDICRQVYLWFARGRLAHAETSVEALLTMGQTLLNAGDPQGALRIHRWIDTSNFGSKPWKIKPGLEWHLLKARCLLGLHDFSAAMEEIRQCYETEEDASGSGLLHWTESNGAIHIRMQQTLGECLYHLGRPQEGLKVLREVQRISPRPYNFGKSEEAWVAWQVARCCGASENWNEVIAEIQKALSYLNQMEEPNLGQLIMTNLGLAQAYDANGQPNKSNRTMFTLLETLRQSGGVSAASSNAPLAEGIRDLLVDSKDNVLDLMHRFKLRGEQARQNMASSIKELSASDAGLLDACLEKLTTPPTLNWAVPPQ